jgi:hypothetical protein
MSISIPSHPHTGRGRIVAMRRKEKKGKKREEIISISTSRLLA